MRNQRLQKPAIRSKQWFCEIWRVEAHMTLFEFIEQEIDPKSKVTVLFKGFMFNEGSAAFAPLCLAKNAPNTTAQKPLG